MMKESEPFFNFSEKTPLFLVGLFTLIHFLTLFSSVPVDHGVLRPLHQSDIGVTSHTFRLFFHGFLHANWGHLLINSAMIMVFGTAISQGYRSNLNDESDIFNPSLLFWTIFLTGVISGGIFQWIWWGFVNSTLSTGAIGASAGAAALFSTGAFVLGGKKKMYEYGVAWVGLNCIIGLFDNFFNINIAWPAHIGGYCAGAVIIYAFSKKTNI
jgi:membrane associated rhomboid family serine protease